MRPGIPHLPVDPAKVARARELAGAAAGVVQAMIDRHTTVAVERTVLRLFGLNGVGPRGVPLSNLMVDRLKDAGVLHMGAAYWLGRALRAAPGKSPLEALDRVLPPIPNAPVEPLAPAEEAALRADMLREARAACEELRGRVTARERLKGSLRLGSSHEGAPLKYVIVATGNIHDDADQGCAAAQAGADVVAVIRSTAQSLLDYVPHGATTEGFGGTYATQENFRIMREALDDESRKLGRYVMLTNYSSGLCMPEIAYLAATERLDMLLNDAMYGILFRDINMRRTFIDQYFSRRICAFAELIINTGEDNYITTADADEAAHTVIASQFVNESFAHRAGLPDRLLGLGHSFEIDPDREDTLLREIAQALLVRTIFPDAFPKYMPPTKHKTGDIFFSHVYDAMADVVAIMTGQSIQLLGMMTEAMHNPFLQDRYAALKAAEYLYKGGRHLGEEIQLKPDGRIVRRAQETLDKAIALLEETARDGMVAVIGRGRFGDVARSETGGKGLAGVVERGPAYFNPFLEILEGRA